MFPASMLVALRVSVMFVVDADVRALVRCDVEDEFGEVVFEVWLVSLGFSEGFLEAVSEAESKRPALTSSTAPRM